VRDNPDKQFEKFSSGIAPLNKFDEKWMDFNQESQIGECVTGSSTKLKHLNEF
jgi:hypothetical protein